MVQITKAFQYTNVAKMMISVFDRIENISVFDRIENIVGKGENAGYQHFLLFQQCFQKACPLGSLKVGLCGKELDII